MKDLEFKGNDPGAVKYGNFINYYSFHSAEERSVHFKTEMFSSLDRDHEYTYVCLDIGCNSGDLTVEQYNYLSTKLYDNNPVHILAIDIDPNLIQRAKENCNIKNITFACLDITDPSSQEYLKLYLDKFHKTVFDVVFCFSVTMWIHLNHGDDGLLTFLQLINNISEIVIVEPQPWNCYKNAQRRMSKSGSNFPLYDIISIRSDVDKQIVHYLKQSNCEVFESSSSSWNRKIFSFKKISK